LERKGHHNFVRTRHINIECLDEGVTRMENILLICIRTVIMYVLILLIFRLMGKREIGELSILDLVVFIMIAEMAVVAIEDTESSLWDTILPMVLLMVIQILMAIISLKSQKFREIVDGKPTVVINKGKIDEAAMRKQRYNFNDLLLQLREKEIKNVADVEFAILEPSGKLSVIKKENSMNHNQPTLALPLVLDGIIQEDHLAEMNKTNLWLRQQLKKRGYPDIKKISYCSYENGYFFVDVKD
jgi:uncharacterized membrane protein YcaP (DUF421 family)